MPKHLTDSIAEEITGVKSFIVSPTLPTAVNPTDAINKGQVELISARPDLSNLADAIPSQEQEVIKGKLGIGGNAPIAYLTMAALYADQANQIANGNYRVDDASAHPDVNAGRAWFDYKGTTVGNDTDYILKSEEESLNLDAQLTAIENRLTVLEAESILNAPLLVDKIPVSQADGSIVWETKPTGGGAAQPNSATLTTTVSITSATLTDGGFAQEGKAVKIDNGVNAINYTVNGLTASFIKGGTGAITFVQGAGRTLTGANGTLVFNGAVNSTASIVSFGTTDILYINNL